MATTTSEAPAQSGVRRREMRTAQAEACVGGERWIVELDGPHLGQMVLIYRQRPGTGWQLWGTAVWLDGRIQHPTALVVLEDVTAALGKALLAALASGAAS